MDLKSCLLAAGLEAQKVITHPPEGIRNYSEWAKKQPCWKRLSEATINYPDGLDNVLIPIDLANESIREAKADKAVETSVEAQIEVFNLGAEFWKEALNWAREHGILGPTELGVIETCAAMPRKIPTDKQCTIAMATLGKLNEKGFRSAQKTDSA